MRIYLITEGFKRETIIESLILKYPETLIIFYKLTKPGQHKYQIPRPGPDVDEWPTNIKVHISNIVCNVTATYNTTCSNKVHWY